MKVLRKLGLRSGVAVFAVFLTACGTRPGIELLSNPLAQTAGVDMALGDNDYSPTTRDLLKQEGLSKQVKVDPSLVIQQLDSRLRETGKAEFRLAAAEVALEQAFRNFRSHKGEVYGYVLTAIELSEVGLSLGESTLHSDLVEIYNEGNAELAWLLHQQASGAQRIAAQGPLRKYTIGWAKGKGDGSQPGFYDKITPTSRIKVKGFEAVNRRPGVGGSVVGYRAPTEKRKADDPFMPPYSGYAVSLTSVVEWSGNGDAKVVLYDLVEDEFVTIRGKRYTLAGDFTAAMASMAAASPSPATGWIGMMRPEKNKKFEGLYTLEPYRPDRIPLVLVHGLLSTPGTWREVVNLCYSDPVIRENYQIMVFFYPTGFPIPLNAAALREDLKAFQMRYDPNRSNPKMREMVMVGHSMGCNLTNFQIRDGGDEFWGKFFNKPLDELGIPEEEYEMMRGAAYFKANPDIDRVVFVCGPHRGSPLSNAWLGRIGANLIRLPFHTVDLLSGNGLASATALGQSIFDESSSSINNLQANSPLLEALLEQPTPYKPKIHSIIGDRGKGSGVGSSDGVVPYWSARIDGSNSEDFIPASHTSATNNFRNVELVREILYHHIGERVPKASQ